VFVLWDRAGACFLVLGCVGVFPRGYVMAGKQGKGRGRDFLKRNEGWFNGRIRKLTQGQISFLRNKGNPDAIGLDVHRAPAYVLNGGGSSSKPKPKRREDSNSEKLKKVLDERLEGLRKWAFEVHGLETVGLSKKEIFWAVESKLRTTLVLIGHKPHILQDLQYQDLRDLHRLEMDKRWGDHRKAEEQEMDVILERAAKARQEREARKARQKQGA